MFYKKLVLLLILSTSFVAFAQSDINNSEIKSHIPELEDFHQIIYPIWHTAYPAKDFEVLKALVNSVDDYSQKIFIASLPGILRDKKEQWDSGIAMFRNAVMDYDKAVKDNNNEELLLAAEELHSKYENLIRVVRPPVKEVDLFHQILYKIYHYYLPEHDYNNIIMLGSELNYKAELITQANLPYEFKSKKERFDSLAVQLYNATEELKNLSDKAKSVTIDTTVEKIHAKYQELYELF